MKKYLSKLTKTAICCSSVIFLFQICNAQITQADSNLTSLIIDSKVLGEKIKYLLIYLQILFNN